MDDAPDQENEPGEGIHHRERHRSSDWIGPVERPMPLVDIAPTFRVLADRNHEGVREVRQMERIEDHHRDERHEPCGDHVYNPSDIHRLHNFFFEGHDDGAHDHRHREDAEVGKHRAGGVDLKFGSLLAAQLRRQDRKKPCQ